MKLKLQLVVLSVLVGCIVFLFTSYKVERQERIRTEQNQNALLGLISYYKTDDSLQVASIERLKLERNELKKYRSEDVETIKKLNIKLRRLESITKTATSSKTEIKTEFKDTIVESKNNEGDHTKIDSLKCIDYIDPFLTVTGCLDKNNHFEGVVEVRDTLTQVVHRIPRKILFIKYGTKAIRQEVFSKNPNTHIDFAEVIELK